MKCVIDGQTELESGQVCDRCRRREHWKLAEIQRLHALLPDALERGSATGPKVAGSREAPLPLGVDALDLSMPARFISLSKVYKDQIKDQIGHLSVATVLDSWVRDWISYSWCPGDHLPVPTVPMLADWLSKRLDYAVVHHEAIDEYSDEVSGLLSALRSACGETRPKPERCDGVPCRDCDLMNVLYRATDGTGDVECAHCGYVLDADSYKDWTRLNAAAAKEMAA